MEFEEPDRAPSKTFHHQRTTSAAWFMETSQDEEVKIVYRVTWYRWLVLAFFSGCLFNTALVTISLATIEPQVSKAYDVSDLMVNLCSTASCIWFLPMSVAAQILYTRLPLKYPMIIAAML